MYAVSTAVAASSSSSSQAPCSDDEARDHTQVAVDKNVSDTVFMNNNVQPDDMMSTEHLDKESHMLNLVSPFMRRKKHGIIHYESPYLLRILAAHKRKKFIAMLAEGQDSATMQRSTVNVMNGGSMDTFWFKYRSAELAIASRFRSTRNIAFKTIDALIVPHIMSRELDDEGAPFGKDQGENGAHIVLFVCYPKLRSIYVYDSMYDRATPSNVPRLDYFEVASKYDSILKAKSRGVGNDNYFNSTMSASDYEQNKKYAMSVLIGYRWCKYGMQMAFHQIENFLHALEIVQKGIVEGRDSDKAPVALKSDVHGTFLPDQFKFVHAGFPDGRTQQFNDCGLWATLAMHDFARNWKTPSRAHSLCTSVASPRAFFTRPSFNVIDYTAAVLVDMIRKYVLSWRYFDSDKRAIKVPTMSALLLAMPRVEPFAVAIEEFYNAACASMFPAEADTTRSEMERIDPSQLTSQRAVDVLIWVVDARNREHSERKVYELIGKALPSIRFLFIVHPGQSIGVYFRKPVDDRRFCRSPGTTLVYSVPPGTQQVHRLDDDIAVATALYVFCPSRESRKDSMVIELPTPNTHYVQWLTGVGWLCHA